MTPAQARPDLDGPILMYREPYETLVETIDRLQRELGDVTALRRPCHERRLWLVTVVSVLCVVLSFAAVGASYTHAAQLERALAEARTRLDSKTQALGACESFAQSSVNTQRQYAVALDRYRTWSCWEP